MSTTSQLVVMSSLVVAANIGCSAETSSQEFGVVSVPLQTTTASGEVYELSGMVELVGPTTVSLIADGSESVLNATVPPGSYTVQLLPGWSLDRLDAGTPTPVVAELLSVNPTTVEATSGQAVTITLRFIVGESLVAFSGDPVVGVDIQVEDAPIFPDASMLCGVGTVCMGGVIAVDTASLSLELAGELVPFSISFDVDSRTLSGLPGDADFFTGPVDVAFDLTGTTASPTTQSIFDAIEADFDGQQLAFTAHAMGPSRVSVDWWSSTYHLTAELLVPLATDADGGAALGDADGTMGASQLCDHQMDPLVGICDTGSGAVATPAFLRAN